MSCERGRRHCQERDCDTKCEVPREKAGRYPAFSLFGRAARVDAPYAFAAVAGMLARTFWMSAIIEKIRRGSVKTLSFGASALA